MHAFVEELSSVPDPARCCELIGQKLQGRGGDTELFLLGLCSLLDAILNRPLTDALADLPLSAEIRAALMGEANVARAVLDVVVAYESGDWDAARIAVCSSASAGSP